MASYSSVNFSSYVQNPQDSRLSVSTHLYILYTISFIFLYTIYFYIKKQTKKPTIAKTKKIEEVALYYIATNCLLELFKIRGKK